MVLSLGYGRKPKGFAKFSNRKRLGTAGLQSFFSNIFDCVLSKVSVFDLDSINHVRISYFDSNSSARSRN